MLASRILHAFIGFVQTPNSPKLLIARSPRSLGRTDDLVALRDTRLMAQRQVQRGVTR